MSVLTRAAPPLSPSEQTPPAPTASRGNAEVPVEHRMLASAALALAMAALVLASVAGFDRVFVDGTWVAPVVASALAAQALAATLRLVRIPPLVAMVLGLLGVAAIGVGAALGLGAFASFPNGTWRSVVDAIEQARTALSTAIAPVPTNRGYDLLAAWGAGVVALLGDWGAFRLRSPAHGAAPGLALFVLCCVLGGPAHRDVDLAGWLAAALLFLLAHQVAM
ncbi:MAG: hypothetical protein J2P58_08635, partial [Acidimicrobiaceae bacterium]|nr:hypothetical protein [Acidimicrobiaceae bacterium]